MLFSRTCVSTSILYSRFWIYGITPPSTDRCDTLQQNDICLCISAFVQIGHQQLYAIIRCSECS